MPKFYKKPDPTQQTRTFTANPSERPEQNPVRTLLEWHAPSRPYRKKDRSYYTTLAIIVILLVLILLLAQEFLLIGVILALTFVAYVLGFVPPEEVEYKISTQGITIGDHFYFWQNLDSFWFSEKEGQKILNILTHFRFPAMLILLLGSHSEDQVRTVAAKYLPYHEIAPRSTLDKWAESLQKHFPLENPHR